MKSKNILYKFAKFIEKCLFKNADEIVVLTNQAKAIVKNWGYNVNNISVIPCCVDTDLFKLNNDFRIKFRKEYDLIDKFIFIHIGSLEYWYMKDKILFVHVCNESQPKIKFISTGFIALANFMQKNGFESRIINTYVEKKLKIRK